MKWLLHVYIINYNLIFKLTIVDIEIQLDIFGIVTKGPDNSTGYCYSKIVIYLTFFAIH